MLQLAAYPLQVAGRFIRIHFTASRHSGYSQTINVLLKRNPSMKPHDDTIPTEGDYKLGTVVDVYACVRVCVVITRTVRKQTERRKTKGKRGSTYQEEQIQNGNQPHPPTLSTILIY